MAIRTLVTRGFGNGTFAGTIALVVTRGYAIGEAVVDATILRAVTLTGRQAARTVTGVQPAHDLKGRQPRQSGTGKV